MSDLVISREEKKGILGWFRGLFGNYPETKKPDWEEMIQDIIVKLKNEQDRFDELEYRTKKRIDELFNKVVDNFKLMETTSREDERKTYQNLGKVYAEEVYELRSFLKAIRFTKISFERVIQRLQTVKDIHDFQSVLGPITNMLSGVKAEVSAIFPKVGDTLDEINRMITEIMVTTSSGNQYNVSHSFQVNEEVDKVIKEAWQQAEKSVDADVPEPEKLKATLAPTTRPKDQSNQSMPQVHTSAVSVPLQLRPSIPTEELEKAVLEEIKKSGGRIVVSELSIKLGVDKDKIYEALYNLSKKGKIKIASPVKS
jgi:division protein CdvB (Snf7/Vps24/ESCRT-III family)